MVTYYKGKIGKEDIEFGTGTFNRRDKDKAWAAITDVNLSQLPRKITAKTAAYSIPNGTYSEVFTNTGATGSVTFTLPNANPGYGPIRFLVAAAQTLVVDPVDAVDLFRDCVAGKTKSSNSAGNILTVWCDVTGIWEWDYELVTGNWTNEA